MTAKRKKKKAEELEQVEQVEEIQETEQVEQVQEPEELEPVEDPEVKIEVEESEPVEVEKVLIGYKVAPGKGVTTRSGMVTGKSKRILQPKDFGQGADCIEKLIELEALIPVYEDVK